MPSDNHSKNAPTDARRATGGAAARQILRKAQELESAVEQRDLEIAKLKQQLSSVLEVRVFEEAEKVVAADSDVGLSLAGLAAKIDASHLRTSARLSQALEVIGSRSSERTQQSLAQQIERLGRQTEKVLNGDVAIFQSASERIDQIAAAINAVIDDDHGASQTERQIAEILETVREFESRFEAHHSHSELEASGTSDALGLAPQQILESQFEIREAVEGIRVVCQEHVLADTSKASRQLTELIAAQNRTEHTLASLQQMLSGLCHGPDPLAEPHWSEDSLDATVIGDPGSAVDADVRTALASIRSRFGVPTDENDDEEIELVGLDDDVTSEGRLALPAPDDVANRLAKSMVFRIESAAPSVPLAELVAPAISEDISELTSEELIAAIHERDEFITGLIHRIRESEAFNVNELIQGIAGPPSAEDEDAQTLVPTHIEEAQRRLNDLLRMAEIEISMERARLSRQRQNLIDVRQQLQKRAKQLNCTVSDDDELIISRSGAGGSGKRRWLSKLGIGKDGCE